MTNTLKLTLLAALACGVTTFALPSTAHAKKPGVLQGKPIVVDKLELRKLRAQVTPYVGMSLSQPFVHKGMVGAKLRFDFTDWIGVRAGFAYGAINVESDLTKQLTGEGGLPVRDEAGGRPPEQIANPAPLLQDFNAGLTRLSWQGSVDAAFTPFAGKLGLFSAIFTEYDMYVFAGLGFNSWENHSSDQSTAEVLDLTTDPDDPTYCEPEGGTGLKNDECLLHPVKADTGVRLGFSFGGGVHLFVTDWLSINPEIHDVVVAHNDTGLNATVSEVPPRVENKLGGEAGDRIIRHNVMLNLGVTFYLPPKAKRSKIIKSRN